MRHEQQDDEQRPAATRNDPSDREARMSDEFDANAEGVDFALVAYREEGVWQLEELAPEAVPA